MCFCLVLRFFCASGRVERIKVHICPKLPPCCGLLTNCSQILFWLRSRFHYNSKINNSGIMHLPSNCYHKSSNKSNCKTTDHKQYLRQLFQKCLSLLNSPHSGTTRLLHKLIMRGTKDSCS